MTKMLLIECEYNSERGRTVLYDSRSGTILFEATEAAAWFLKDVTEVGIKIALKCGEIEAELEDESEHIKVEAWILQFSPNTQTRYECIVGYEGAWMGNEDELKELVLDHYRQEHEVREGTDVRLITYKTVEV